MRYEIGNIEGFAAEIYEEPFSDLAIFKVPRERRLFAPGVVRRTSIAPGIDAVKWKMRRSYFGLTVDDSQAGAS